MQNQATKHTVVVARKVGTDLVDPKVVGYSLLIEGNDYYLLRLFQWDDYYFVVKNRNSPNTYTIFASKQPNAPIFKCPVGQAKLHPDLKSYLEINFHLLGTSMFMDLFPDA